MHANELLLCTHELLVSSRVPGQRSAQEGTVVPACESSRKRHSPSLTSSMPISSLSPTSTSPQVRRRRSPPEMPLQASGVARGRAGQGQKLFTS